jgi:hypothetical protein
MLASAGGAPKSYVRSGGGLARAARRHGLYQFMPGWILIIIITGKPRTRNRSDLCHLKFKRIRMHKN